MITVVLIAVGDEVQWNDYSSDDYSSDDYSEVIITVVITVKWLQ
jgi:hypothetical protein